MNAIIDNQTIDVDDLRKRISELERRERDVALREKIATAVEAERQANRKALMDVVLAVFSNSRLKYSMDGYQGHALMPNATVTNPYPSIQTISTPVSFQVESEVP